ncbi:MAG: hypothetical protein JWN40_5702 [Phycisphaerales bacterium]|nr:hypothetical protein [Phycisphaerales bacterium]
MRERVRTTGIAVLILCVNVGLARRVAGADGPEPVEAFPPPATLSLLPEDQSVYAPPAPPREDEGLNAGGVNFDLQFRYATDNVYRGVSRSEGIARRHSPNLQFDGRADFNLGKLPHPFVGAFVNIHSSDPISRFQEVRPYVGLSWNVRPFVLEGGNITYIFPERDELNTGEVYAKVTFDDSWLFRTDTPILSPYGYAAYDYDKYDGWYFEAGLKHDFVFENTGLTITALANLAFVASNSFYATKPGGKETGLQHYEVGVVGNYSLNHLFHFSPRYGTFTLQGFVYYDDRTSSNLRADIQIWGGGGIGFHY